MAGRRILPVAFAGLAAATLAAQASAQPPPVVDTPPVIAPPPPVLVPAPASCAPAALFRTVIRNISPGLAASDSRAQPRQLWRHGSKFLRSVQQPMPNGDQAVFIVAEPDIWVINEATRTGRHSVDPGPVFEVRAPILPMAKDMPPELRSLEFGCEAEFVARYAPQSQQIINWGAAKAGIHIYSSGEHSVAILMDTRRSGPVMISYLRGGRPVFVLRYDEYRHGLPDRPDLFAPGKSVKITEVEKEAPPLPLD